MAIAFKKVTLGPLQAFTANAPNSALIGVIGENGSGKRALLRLAAGLDVPSSGSVNAGKTRRFLGPSDEPSFEAADTLLLEHTLARTKPRGWHLTDEPVAEGGVSEAWLSFETELGRGRGYLRL